MESITRPIKELMMISLGAIIFGGIFLSFVGLLMAVSY
jgi:hypothetical protein